MLTEAAERVRWKPQLRTLVRIPTDRKDSFWRLGGQSSSLEAAGTKAALRESNGPGERWRNGVSCLRWKGI